MIESDRKLIGEAVGAMYGLRAEMQEFRGEMREFKQQTITRIAGLEEEAGECQKNPAVCATSRSLECHLQGHKSGKSLAVSLWAACVSTAMCAFNIALAVLKRS